jgi:hypothetical protein
MTTTQPGRENEQKSRMDSAAEALIKVVHISFGMPYVPGSHEHIKSYARSLGTRVMDNFREYRNMIRTEIRPEDGAKPDDTKLKL